MSQEKPSSSMADMYAAFDMDEDAETRGVPVNFGRFVVTLARVGGGNDLYRKTFEQESKPVATALELGELPEGEARQLLYRVFARAVVKNWQFRESTWDADGKEQRNLLTGFGRDAKGEVVEFNEANLIALWTQKHELFLRIKEAAEMRELYQVRNRESVAKNLLPSSSTS